MDVLYLLIPLSVLAMLGVLGVFAWALHGGQFDELEDEGARILCADLGRDAAGLDADQGPKPPA
jgi:cbb3-type cytochrome oxidase maturation protein